MSQEFGGKYSVKIIFNLDFERNFFMNILFQRIYFMAPCFLVFIHMSFIIGYAMNLSVKDIKYGMCLLG